MKLANLRLKDKRLIERITKKGQSYRTPLGLIRFVKYPKKCFTVVTSKKSIKLATDRNRAKRRVRALIVKSIDRIPHMAIVFYINPNVNKLKWNILFQKWLACLEDWHKKS